MTQTTIDLLTAKAVSYRVSKGHNRAESEKLLPEIIQAWAPSNLAYALCYEAFGTAAACEKLAAALLLEVAK